MGRVKIELRIAELQVPEAFRRNSIQGICPFEPPKSPQGLLANSVMRSAVLANTLPCLEGVLLWERWSILEGWLRCLKDMFETQEERGIEMFPPECRSGRYTYQLNPSSTEPHRQDGCQVISCWIWRIEEETGDPGIRRGRTIFITPAWSSHQELKQTWRGSYERYHLTNRSNARCLHT